MIVCAGGIENFGFAKPVGIGLVDVAINLTKICLFDKPDYILFVGTAGSYGEFDIYDIVNSSTATNIELGYFENRCYTHINNTIKATNNKITSETIVNSSNYITIDDKFSQDCIKHGIGIENMEFYSVVKTANFFDIPVGGVFIVTNYTNKNAKNDFQANHKQAMLTISKYLQNNK